MTLASVVISGAMRRPSSALRSAKLSTSPLSDGDDERAVALALLGAVDRVGVGLADDADRRPAGVPEHDGDRLVGRDGQAQQVVGPEGVAQRPGVVAQLADLGGRLVDERQAPVDHPHRARAEQRVGRPAPQQPGDGGAVDVEAVVADEDVQPGRVAAPHLEPVDGRQRLLDRRVRLGRPPARLAAGQVGHGAGGADAVLLDRPHRVLEPDHRGVDRLERGGVTRPGPVGCAPSRRARARRSAPSGASPSRPASRLASMAATVAARVVHTPSTSASRRRSWTSAHTPSAPRSRASAGSTCSAATAQASASGRPPASAATASWSGLGDLGGRCCLARAGATDDRDDPAHGRTSLRVAAERLPVGGARGRSGRRGNGRRTQGRRRGRRRGRRCRRAPARRPNVERAARSRRAR